jgi:cell division septal protein FtsQ
MARRKRTLQSKKYTHKKRKRTALAAGIWIVCIVACLSAIVFVLRFDKLLIHDVQIAGTVAVPSDQVKEIVDSYLGQSWLGMIPRTSYFMYPSAAIATAITSQIPRVDTVRLVRHGDILSVNITERVPSAVVCPIMPDGLPADAAVGDCFFSDDSAFIYAKAPAQSGTIYVEFDGDFNATTTVVSIGQAFMNAHQFVTLRKLTDDVSKIGLDIVKVNIMTDGDIDLTAKAGTVIHIRTAETYETVASNLQLFLDKIRSTKKASDISIIDLRYGNSVFYKLSSEAPAGTSAK